jgi:hypothetical protein
MVNLPSLAPAETGMGASYRKRFCGHFTGKATPPVRLSSNCRSHRPAWLRTAHELKTPGFRKMVVMLDAEVEQLTNILSKTTELSGGLQPTGEIERMSSDALKAIEEASKEE